MAKRLQPEIANTLTLGETEILPLVKSVLDLLRSGASQKRIALEANDLNRFLLSDEGLALMARAPATAGAVGFAIKLLTMHANDTTPSVVPNRGASLALLAPSVGGRARLADEDS